MSENDIDYVLDHLRRIKSEGDVNSFKIDQIETLEMELRFLRSSLKYNHVLLPDVSVKITKKAKLIVEMLQSVFGGNNLLNVESPVSHLLEFIQDNTSSRFNYVLDDCFLLEYMDYLDKNLYDALRYIVKSDPLLIKEIKILQKKMRFLRYLYGTKMTGYVDDEKLKGLRTRIQFMAENVGHFYLDVWIAEDGEDADSKEDNDNTFTIESKPPYLLFQVVLVELEMKNIFLNELKASKFTQSRTFKDRKLPKGFSDYLRHLLLYLRNKKLKNFPVSVTTRDIIVVAIEFLLVIIGNVPNHFINGKRLNEVLENVGVIVGDILCTIQMFLVGSTIEEDTNKIDISMIRILEKIEDLKAQVGTCYKSFKFIPSHKVPIVGGLSFLDSLLRKFNEMLKSESGLDFMMKPHIVILEKELSSLACIFRDLAKVQHEHTILRHEHIRFELLQRRTISLAYDTEVVIDSMLAQYNAFWHIFCSLPTIVEMINSISVEVHKMWPAILALNPCSVVEQYKHLPTRHSNPVNDEEIVGFEYEAKEIIDCLTLGTREQDVIPIVGMGGQGKTTCARKTTITRDFRSSYGSDDKGDEVGKLSGMLRQSLMTKRYLIVLDDMRDGMAWDELRLSFPDVGNRSRIIITTRLEEVAKKVKYHTDPYSLPFLALNESCKLLQKKVFHQEGCPTELQVVSEAVARKCKGLPLVVVLVAGIIKKNKMEASWWHEVKSSLLSYIGKSEEYSLATMHLSYDNLPDYLRPCLLYMGMFPEDAIIPVSKLISLWIAEGFVRNIESGRLMEEVAEGYLTELISSNVVMVSGRRYNNTVKYCQVHDVVLHFCLEKSKEEKFMLAVKGYFSHFQTLSWNETRLSFNFIVRKICL
ncbi:hypothetical protein BC332_06267 [Capsicum chinense]|nr:hypothetical protein BC332_06267 [Capsicum chinense]